MKKFLHILVTLKVGDRLVVPKSSLDLVQHHAIYLGFWKGHYWFIENKEGIGVRVVRDEVFFYGVDKITRIKKFIPTINYSRTDLYNYALTLRGKAYNLINYNCEHTANQIQNRVVKSKQSENGVGLALLGLSLFLIFGIAGGSGKK